MSTPVVTPTPAPLYQDLGKDSKDLFSKDFPTNYKVEYNTTSVDGVNFVTSLSQKGDGSLFASLAAKYKLDFRGGVEVKTTLESQGDPKVDLTFEKLVPGLKAMLTASRGFKGGFEYKTARAAFNATLNYPMSATPTVSGAAVVALTRPVAAGVETEYGLGDQPELKKLNGLLSYKGRDFSGTVGVNSSGDDLAVAVGYSQSLESLKSVVAAKLNYDLRKNAVDSAMVASYTLPDASVLKGKIDTNGNTGLSWASKLSANTKVVAGAEFSVHDPAKPPSIGVNVTFTN